MNKDDDNLQLEIIDRVLGTSDVDYDDQTQNEIEKNEEGETNHVLATNENQTDNRGFGEIDEEKPPPLVWGMDNNGNLTRSTMRLIRQSLDSQYLIPHSELSAAPTILMEMINRTDKPLSTRSKIMAMRTLMEMRRHNFEITQVAVKLLGGDTLEDVKLLRSPFKVG